MVAATSATRQFTSVNTEKRNVALGRSIIQFPGQKEALTVSIIYIPPVLAATEASRRSRLEALGERMASLSRHCRKRKNKNEKPIGVGDWD